MMSNRYTSKEIFSKLVFTQRYYTPFNWDYEVPDTLVKNISNNKVYLMNAKYYDYICSLYYKDDLNSLINGCFLFNDTYFSIKKEDFSKYILRWNYFKKNYKKIIKKDLTNVSKVINNNIQFDINTQEYFNKCEDNSINGLTLAYLYLVKDGLIDKVKIDSKETKSLEKLNNYKILYKNVKMLKSLIKLRRKEN